MTATKKNPILDGIFARMNESGIDGETGISRARLTSEPEFGGEDRKSTRLNSSHITISYAVFCLTKKKNTDAKARQHMEPNIGTRT